MFFPLQLRNTSVADLGKNCSQSPALQNVYVDGGCVCMHVCEALRVGYKGD